ncbi:MAG: O-antigen ligase family protein [Gammaproteobacteria bacterium]|nr:O-antigen ligase family protein [Gammaproteobacteria bacterium]
MNPTGTVVSAPQLNFNARTQWLPGMLALLMGLGSVVFIEPAPYDLVAIGLFLALLAAGLRFPRELQSAVILLGLFIAANVLAALLAPDPLQSVRSLSIRIYMPLTFLLIACIVAARPQELLPALWAGYLFAAVLAVAWGALEYLGFLPGELWAGGLRAKGGFKDPNVFGPFLVPAAVHVVRRMAGGPAVRSALFLPLFLVLTFGVLLSFSRGAWINFIISVGVFGLLSFLFAPSLKTRVNWLLASIAVLAVIAGGLAATVSLDVIGERFFQRAVLTQQYDVKTGGRFDSQGRALAHIGSDPIGVGPGRSDEEFGLEPHNLYLHVLVESGWLGGLTMIAFLILTGLRLLPLLRYRNHPLKDDVFLVVSCLTGLLLQSLFIDSTHWRHMWLLLALAWGLSIALQRRHKLEKNSRFMSKATVYKGATGYPDHSAQVSLGPGEDRSLRPGLQVSYRATQPEQEQGKVQG